MSYLAGRLGKQQEAASWEQRAVRLQEHFLRRFWWEEELTFYLALDGAKEPCAVVSSNAGQCLWTGIVPDVYAQKLMARLMRNDMYSGWGMPKLPPTQHAIIRLAIIMALSGLMIRQWSVLVSRFSKARLQLGCSCKASMIQVNTREFPPTRTLLWLCTTY